MMESREAERRKNLSLFLSGLPMCNSSFLNNFVPSRETRPQKVLYKDITVDNSRSVLLQFGQTHPFLKEVEKERQIMKQREREIELEAQRLNNRKRKDKERAHGDDKTVKKKKI